MSKGNPMSALAHTVLTTSRAALDERALPAVRLLIVDDVADNRAALSGRFAKGGFEIVEADCGTEALRLVQEQTFDVMLLDMTMPDMNGTEILRRIREKFSASLLPVIMVTPDSQAEDIIEAMRIGANDYLTKPIDFSIALARVNNQVARRRAELELRNVNTMSKADERERPAARLLIVDDIADNRALLSRQFAKRGFEIVEADCGAEALRLVRERTFDVVLLDVMMPDMDGMEVLHRIREEFSASLLPVIMVTAKDQSEDIVAALKTGANDYVTKPVDLSIALARVNNQVARCRAEAAIRKANESLLNAMTHLEQRVALEKQIAHLAHHDMLTGLSNRFAFDERLNAARQFARDSGSQLSLLFVDLDGFKYVNDALGHAVGDEFLKEVAARLAKVVGTNDFCARLGGDEFAVVHVSRDVRTTAASLAQAIILTVDGCNYVGRHQVFVGASVGISVLESGDNDSATLLKRADLAMYRAKADGRGVYRFFETNMGEQAILRRSLELDLRRAAENGDFQLYYQPIVGLKERKVVGFEALMRWNHPTRGFVPPSEFIPLAEETGLIVPIGERALRQACADAAQWPNNLRVAINLSPVQFRSTGLISAVVMALSASGLPAERLELEITESVVLRNSAQNMFILGRLRDLDVRIALDDFGTGYSGLGYLRAFQFDKIKIDRSFIQEMLRHPESRAIVRAAIGLGGSLGLCTTAEGVESLDQFEYLVSQGCTEVQGFLFSPAQPNVKVAAMVAEIGRRIDGREIGRRIDGRKSAASTSC
jgi:diguanylate cyclase (GGDEF)-like protein